MLKTWVLAVALVAYLPGLRLRGALTDTVFAEKIRTTAISSIAEMTFTAKGARTLLKNVGVQRQCG
jgi:hypothetical protein